LLIENLVEQFRRPTHLHSMQASKPHPQNSNPCSTYFRLADGVSLGKRRKRKDRKRKAQMEETYTKETCCSVDVV
jgi:hypothetical protein